MIVTINEYFDNDKNEIDNLKNESKNDEIENCKNKNDEIKNLKNENIKYLKEIDIIQENILKLTNKITNFKNDIKKKNIQFYKNTEKIKNLCQHDYRIESSMGEIMMCYCKKCGNIIF